MTTKTRLRHGFWRDFDHARKLARDMVSGSYAPHEIAAQRARIDDFFQELRRIVEDRRK